MPDTLGERSGALAGDFYEFGVGGDLVEYGEEALGFGDEAAVEVGLELEEGVVDAEAVVLDAAGDEGDVFLLAGEAFEDLQKLGTCRVKCIVKFSFVCLTALLPAERFFAEVSDFAMDIEVLILKTIELGSQVKHFGAQSGADFKGRSAGVFVQLANVVGGGVGVVAYGDFDEFGRAGFEDAAES